MTVQQGSRSIAKPRLRAVPDEGTSALLPRHSAPPRFPAGLVGLATQRVWLDQLFQHEIGIVCAPVGYGKTAWCATLFAEAVAADWRTTWLSIDAETDAAMLLAAFGLDLSEDIGAPAGADALARLIDADPRPMLFVADNADRLADPVARGVLAGLVRYPPERLRLVVIGRARPDIALGDVEARGMALAIGRADLGMSDTAIQQFLAASGIALDASEVRSLNRFLLGWPAGVRMAAQCGDDLRAMAAAGDWRPLARRLAAIVDPVVEALPAAMGDMLVRGAVAPWLDDALCLLMGGGDSGTAVRDLASHSTFLEADGDGGFRILPAVRAALKIRLDPADAVQLHRVAGRYYAARGRTADAVDQFLACGDLDDAAGLIAELAMPMIRNGAIDRVAAWIDHLPPEKVAAAPRLARARAWLALFRGESGPTDHAAPDEARALDLLRRAYADDRPDDIVETSDRLLAASAGEDDFVTDMVRVALAEGAAGRGLFGLVHDALRPVMQHGVGRPLDLAGALAARLKARVSRAQGQLGEAERLLREAKARHGGSGLASALADAALARACYERDALDDAADLSAQALPYLEGSIFQDALIDAFIVAIRVAASAGQGDRAASLIDRAELLAFHRGWAPLKALCIVERARLRLPQTIDAETVVAIGEEERAIVDPLSAPARAFALLSEMRAYEAIANGDRPRLTTVADRLLRLASSSDSAELRASATLFNILPQLSGRCDKMVELETVRFLNHAASRGFRRTIVDVLDVTGVRAVQNFCSEAYSSDCFLALLKLAEPSRRNPALEGGYSAAPGEAFSFLTEREIEILSALNVGESNKEIARTLHLAPETVKWHLKNVMRKLRAGSREEAVVNATMLGLKLIDKAPAA